MQASRHLVGVVVELAARVEHREHDFRGRPTALVHVDRNPASVVDDRDRVVDVDGDVDLVAETGEGFVDGVVDDLVHEMVKAWLTGRADVHGRALAHGLETFEHLDLVSTVFVDGGRLHRAGRLQTWRWRSNRFVGPVATLRRPWFNCLTRVERRQTAPGQDPAIGGAVRSCGPSRIGQIRIGMIT